MGGGEALLMVVMIGVSVCCPLALFALLFGAMVGMPLIYNKRIDAWTADATPAEAYQKLGEGASTSGFMVRPASFMTEGTKVSAFPADQVLAHIAGRFTGGWGREVVTQDATGIVVQMRFLKFVAMDLGWVGAVVVEPAPEGGTRVHYRFRTTYMWPVITFFLTIRLNMHVIPHMVPPG